MKTIINTRKGNLVTEAKIRLRPGENVLGEEKARGLADSKAAQQWFKLGWIRAKPSAKAATLEDDLDASDTGEPEADAPGPMSAKDAIDFVGVETDTMVLEGMLEAEDRKTVTAAIERRLEELSGDGGEGEPEDGGEG